MKEESFIKKIFNFFLHIFLGITSFIKRLFGKDKEILEDLSKEEKQVNKDNINKKDISNKDNATLPDTPISNGNDYSSNSNEVILKLTNKELSNLKNSKLDNVVVLSDELIDQLINEYLEEKEYKDEKLKIKDVNKELEEKIIKLKEKIVPILKKDIDRKRIETVKELKNEIEKVVKEEVLENPLMPKISDIKKSNKEVKNKDTYFIATPLKKKLKVKEDVKPKVKLEDKVISTDNNKVKEEVLEKPFFMVQNVDEIPKPSIKEEIKNTAIVGGMIAGKAVLDIVTPLEDKKEDVKPKVKDELNLKEDERPVIKNDEDVIVVELPKLKEIKEEIKEIDSDVKDEVLDSHKEEVTDNAKVIDTEEDVKVKEEVKDEEEVKEIVIEEETPIIEEDEKVSSEVFNLAFATSMVINDSKKETEKKELEDKQYDFYERQIDKMLDNIEDTLIKYDGRISEKQKKKLRNEQDKLRDARDNLHNKKQEDILEEERVLDETIKQVELDGLQAELKKLHIDNQLEMNNELLNRMNGLDNLTREQIANIDKKMLFKRLDKASLLLEMSSILALPFVRNKYFFYFTVGLIIDNHFNFINAFFRRKMNRYEPVNLDQVKQGEDALNSALNVTYKNIVELEYIEQEALSRYPELINDPRFTNKITSLKLKLDNNYNKLMRKKQVMEKYHRKAKSQIKVLKKEEIRKAA